MSPSWSWRELSRDALAFEETDAYVNRRKRDRFTRSMLSRYLAAVVIDVDDAAIYGTTATLFTEAQTTTVVS